MTPNRLRHLLELAELDGRLGDTQSQIEWLRQAVREAVATGELDIAVEALSPLARAAASMCDFEGAAVAFLDAARLSIQLRPDRRVPRRTTEADRSARWAAFFFARAGRPTQALEMLEAGLCIAVGSRARIQMADPTVLANISSELVEGNSLHSEQLVADWLGQVLRVHPTFAWRLTAAELASAASEARPVLYFNPTPWGTLILRLGGQAPDGIGYELVPSITSTDLARDLGVGDRSGLLMQLRTEGPGKRLDTLLGALGSSLIDPAVGLIDMTVVRGVAIVPSDYLTYLPLHAAPYGRAGETLADQCPVSYLPCASLQLTRIDKRSDSASPRLVGVANASSRWGALPRAETELRQVRSCFVDSATRFGPDATLEFLLTSLHSGDYVHLGLHAGTEIAVSADVGLPGEVAIEFADEVVGVYRLTNELAKKLVHHVYASACMTAQPDPDADLDEALGLPALGIARGCSTVVSTLWAVRDDAAALVAARYYENLLIRHLPPANAIRDATIWLRGLSHADAHHALWRRLSNARTLARGGLMSAFMQWARVLLSSDNRPYSSSKHWAAYVVHTTDLN